MGFKHSPEKEPFIVTTQVSEFMILHNCLALKFFYNVRKFQVIILPTLLSLLSLPESFQSLRRATMRLLRCFNQDKK